MSASSDKKAVEAQAPSVDNQDIAVAILALAEAIKTGQANSGHSEQLSNIEKFLMEREQARPHENLFNPPMKSHFNPLGERDHPRDELKCQMFWAGYKMTKDNLRQSEIELLNRIDPGVYRVTKADGRTIPFTVVARTDDTGKLDRMNFHFACKSAEDRSNHLSMESYLKEALGEVSSTESLRAQIETLKSQLANYQG
jgi:hypothetical protein